MYNRAFFKQSCKAGFVFVVICALIGNSSLISPVKAQTVSSISSQSVTSEGSQTNDLSGIAAVSDVQSLALISNSSSVDSSQLDGSLIGITDPSLIPNAKVYDFSSDPEFSQPNSFPDGSFSGDGQVRVVGSSWPVWGQPVGKHVLWVTTSTIDINFTVPVRGVAVEATTILTAVSWPVTIEAFDEAGVSLGSFTRSIFGSTSEFLGLLSSSNNIAKITINCNPFSTFTITDLTYSSTEPEPEPVVIAGTTGVQGVILNYVDGTPKSVMSTAFGLYWITVPYGWSGTVTPSKDGYTFFPPSISYNNVLADVSEQNYIAKQQVIDYWAIGDSIASGHGLKDDDSFCRRSTDAYPYLVEKALQERYVTVNFPTHMEGNEIIYHHLACSGATLREPDLETMQKDSFKWFEKQVDYVIDNMSDRPTLVTITIGANDLGWSNIPDFLTRLKWTDEDKYTRWIDNLVDNPNSGIEVLLAKQVQRLLWFQNVSVVITEIHNPVNPKSSLFAGTTWANACGWSASTCYTRTKYAVTKLNGAIIQVVLDYNQFDRLQASAIQGKFVGHESAAGLCGLQVIGQPYVQYPYDGYSDSWSGLPDRMRKALHIDKGGDCFHPNLEGAQVFASAVNDDAIRVGK